MSSWCLEEFLSLLGFFGTPEEYEPGTTHQMPVEVKDLVLEPWETHRPFPVHTERRTVVFECHVVFLFDIEKLRSARTGKLPCYTSEDQIAYGINDMRLELWSRVADKVVVMEDLSCLASSLPRKFRVAFRLHQQNAPLLQPYIVNVMAKKARS